MSLSEIAFTATEKNEYELPVLGNRCYWHIYAYSKQLKSEKLNPQYEGCSPIYGCSGSPNGNKPFCRKYISFSEYLNHECLHHINSKRKNQLKETLNEDEDRCLKCHNKEPCYVDIQDFLRDRVDFLKIFEWIEF